MSRTVFFDLLTARNSEVQQCDVCIVGGGAAGIFLATQLASQGLEVILLEAGGRSCRNDEEIGFVAECSGSPYAAATSGRAFGIGGTTSRWGGLLAPHSSNDLRDNNSACDAAWKTIVARVVEKGDVVLAALDHKWPGQFSDYAQSSLGPLANVLLTAGIKAEASLFLPFRRKNLSFLLERGASVTYPIRVYVNAVAASWAVGSANAVGAEVRNVTAKASNGISVDVVAKQYVVAAGAIESARILLEIDSSCSIRVLPQTSALGCYLGDHLSVSIADVAPASRDTAIRLFGPRFEHGCLRGFRFIDSDADMSTPRAFAHFIFENENPGFVLARSVLNALQRRSLPDISSRELFLGSLGVARLGFAKYAQSVLYIPKRTPSHLQLDIEQSPLRKNCVSLGERRDAFGRRKALISWNIGDADLKCIDKAAQRILRKWGATSKNLPVLIPHKTECTFLKPHDAYHPVGTCRMGTDPEAVVDIDLKVRGMANLSVASTGVLPSAGTANPTFSMLCLTQVLAERLSASLKRRQHA